MPWTPVGFDPNSLELVRNDGSYSADYSQHIVSDGGNITLPEPSKDEVVMVSNFDSTSTTIDSVSGNIEFETSRTIDGTEPVIFVSDGNNWWNVSGFSSLTPSIPDSEDLHARYDWAEEDGSLPVSDQTGNNNDCVSATR